MTSRREARSEQKRAMYAGGRPNDQAKQVHRRFADGPLPRVLPIAAVLHVRGRSSGNLIRVPIVVVPYGRHWYTVSMLGEQSNWVRNLRAAEGDAELTHGRRRGVHLTEVPIDQRAPIIKRYLMFAFGARPHMPVRWNDP
ncbi:MAG: nitroreductase/quinone reductase family protein, partial [Actinomycetota bacterium]|nr:nitroreductase/quinone reductase family protein [Actinomycetota bacterium]